MNTTDITLYMKGLKQKIDNDSFVFLYEDTSPICISREALEKTTEREGNTPYSFSRVVLKKINYYHNLKNILYKNKSGKWINYSRLQMDYYETYDLIALANESRIYENYSISPSYVPEAEYFIDNQDLTHYIEKGDGETFSPKRVIPFDEKNPEIVKIEQYSIDYPNLGSDSNHRKQDLKITLMQEEKAEDLLVWLNGIFVEPVYDANNPKVFYIRDAKNVMDTIGISIADNDFKDYSNYEVLKRYTPKNKYYYNVNLKIWKWEDVTISKQWNTVKFSKSRRLVHDYIGYDVVTELYFEHEINPQANILLLNGQILHETEYTIDTTNRKHVYLNKIFEETSNLLNEILEKGYTNPYAFLKSTIMNRYFYAINLSDKNTTRNLLVNHVKPVKKGFPYINDILFRNPRLFDLVLVNGFYIPYVLYRNGVYRYPNTVDSFFISNNQTVDNFIWKLDVCSE